MTIYRALALLKFPIGIFLLFAGMTVYGAVNIQAADAECTKGAFGAITVGGVFGIVGLFVGFFGFDRLIQDEWRETKLAEYRDQTKAQGGS